MAEGALGVCRGCTLSLSRLELKTWVGSVGRGSRVPCLLPAVLSVGQRVDAHAAECTDAVVASWAVAAAAVVATGCTSIAAAVVAIGFTSAAAVVAIGFTSASGSASAAAVVLVIKASVMRQ